MRARRKPLERTSSKIMPRRLPARASLAVPNVSIPRLGEASCASLLEEISAISGRPITMPRAVPKAPPLTRSESFKALCRTKPCVCCRRRPSEERPSDPAHVGPRGVGQKTDDTRCVPACRRCHRFRDINGYWPLDGRRTIELHRVRTPIEREHVQRLITRSRLIIAEASVELLDEWIKAGGRT